MMLISKKDENSLFYLLILDKTQKKYLSALRNEFKGVELEFFLPNEFQTRLGKKKIKNKKKQNDQLWKLQPPIQKPWIPLHVNFQEPQVLTFSEYDLSDKAFCKVLFS